MQKSITKEVKKCFSKPTEKSVKKRGISLSKHWICAYKSHLLGVSRLPARSVLLNAKCIQRSPPETRTPKTRKTGGKKMKLTKTIFLYLNKKEFSMLTKDAERANMSISRYIRHQIDNAKMKPTLNMDYEKYINLLEPICDKLSIVSKRVWQTKMLDTVMLREVLKSTNEIMPEIIKSKEVCGNRCYRHYRLE